MICDIYQMFNMTWALLQVNRMISNKILDGHCSKNYTLHVI